MDGIRKHFWLAIAVLLLSAAPAAAMFGTGGGFNPGDGGSFGSGPFGGGGGGASESFLGFDVSGATRQRRAHGVLAAVAFAVVFPAGAAALRLLPGRVGFWAHAFAQVVAWVMFVAAAVLGFVLVREVRVPGVGGDGSMMSNPNVNYHPILGVVIFALIAFQPLLGYLHHRQYKRTQERTAVSHLHLWNGRLVIVLGIVNGGLGLMVSGAPPAAKLGYTIVAAVMGGAWLLVTIIAGLRRARGRDVFGRAGGGPTGSGVRMERIDKAVRAEGGEYGRHGPPPRATYA